MDTNCEEALDKVVDDYLDEMIDVRPYIWEHPYTVTVFDSLNKCLQIFICNHLRHLIVVNPGDGSVAGVITRKDLFNYLGL